MRHGIPEGHALLVLEPLERRLHDLKRRLGQLIARVFVRVDLAAGEWGITMRHGVPRRGGVAQPARTSCGMTCEPPRWWPCGSARAPQTGSCGHAGLINEEERA